MAKKSNNLEVLPVVGGKTGQRCEIGVCVGYSCRKAGSKDLRSTLEREIWRRRLDDKLSVCTIGCLDRCTEGPNIQLLERGPVIAGVRPRDVAKLIDRLLSRGKHVG